VRPTLSPALPSTDHGSASDAGTSGHPLHAFTVDVEDWYHGIPVAADVKTGAERRLSVGMDALLELLAERGVHGTFFFLGPIAREHPGILRATFEAGHEIGCHGWSHDLLYEMSPERFRDETRRAMDAISEVTGAPVTAYRAAYFSITERSLWALEVLASLGFRYDSSIFPVRNWRYGIPGFPPEPRRMETPAGPILEMPLSVMRAFGRIWPAGGGAYFRLYPYAVTRSNIRGLERAGRNMVFYLHPWELDPDHPRVSFYWKAHLTHYANLGATRSRLRRLLADFRFDTLGRVLEHELAGKST